MELKATSCTQSVHALSPWCVVGTTEYVRTLWKVNAEVAARGRAQVQHGFTLHCLHVPTRPEMIMLDPFSAISAQSFTVKSLLTYAECDGGKLERLVHPRSDRMTTWSTSMGCVRSGQASVSQHHQDALLLARLSSAQLFLGPL